MPNARPSYIAAAAAVEVVSDAGAPKTRIQLMPLGAVVLRDGRGPYQLPRDAAQAVVEATRRHAGRTDIMVDYDHQSFYAAGEGKGGRAEAAGWIDPASLTVDDSGIWASVTWTAAAEAKLKAREYRYLSPLFTFDPATKIVRSIRNAGLTNTPAIDELAAVASLDMETQMDLSKIAVAAGLAASATEGDIVAKVTALAGVSAALVAAGHKLGLAPEATPEELVAAAAKPDPAKHAPVEVVASLQAEVAALKKAGADREADAAVAAARAEGKVSPAMEEWATSYARADLDGFKAYVAKAPVIVAAGEQFARQAEAPGGDGLTAEERKVAASMGVSAEAYLAAKKEGN